MATPAMKSSGMFLRPVEASKKGSAKPHLQPRKPLSSIHSALQHFQSSVVWPYGRILALAAVTVIIPAMHREIKIWRENHLERREREWRLRNLRRFERDFRSNYGDLGSGRDSDGVQRQPQSAEQLQSSSRLESTATRQNPSQAQLLRSRSMRRKSHIISTVTETILGFSDVVLPPLSLINYLSYLWGFNNMPDLGMRLCGWEYASVHDFEEYIGRGNASTIGGNTGHGSLGGAHDFGGMQQYQRHANFQYGNRRLMVEEFLRTVSAVAPPRREGNGLDGSINAETVGRDDRNVGSDARRTTSTDAAASAIARSTSSSSSSPSGKKGWFKDRFLSFMGVVEEKESDPPLTANQLR